MYNTFSSVTSPLCETTSLATFLEYYPLINILILTLLAALILFGIVASFLGYFKKLTTPAVICGLVGILLLQALPKGQLVQKNELYYQKGTSFEAVPSGVYAKWSVNAGQHKLFRRSKLIISRPTKWIDVWWYEPLGGYPPSTNEELEKMESYFRGLFDGLKTDDEHTVLAEKLSHWKGLVINIKQRNDHL